MEFCPKRLLEEGPEHRVAELDRATLIKWPRVNPPSPRKSFEVINDELKWLTALQVPMPATTACPSSTVRYESAHVHVPYCILTERKEGTHLTRRDFERPEVRRDFAHILRASRTLEVQIGRSIDLFYFHTPLDALDPNEVLTKNLLVCPDGLVLVDSSLRVIDQADSYLRLINRKVQTGIQHLFGKGLLLSR